MTLTRARLHELLHYDPETGVFKWVHNRVGKGAGRKKEIAGARHNRGYISIRLDRSLFLAHRLAWLYMTGEWPADQIDHINGNRSDNCWANLRGADPTLNGENQRSAQVTSSTKLLGVSANKSRWAASIKVKGVRYHLGTYDTPEAAHAVYVAAKRRLHAGCTI